MALIGCLLREVSSRARNNNSCTVEQADCRIGIAHVYRQNITYPPPTNIFIIIAINTAKDQAGICCSYPLFGLGTVCSGLVKSLYGGTI